MATAATSLLGLALPVTGELSGTWGDTVNVSITALLDTAVAGTTTLSSDADVTLTTTTLAANQARQAIILWTAGGTVTRTITVPAQSKSYIVINKTSSSQSIKIVGVGPTTGVTIVAGTAAFVVWNGVDFVTASVTSTTGVLPVANGGTGLSSGTSGGVLAYTATGTLASSAALAASALVIGGGAGAAPSTTTTGTGVVTALGVNTGTAGAFVVNGGALGSPSSVGTMPAFTLGGTVSGGGNQINNVVIGTTTPLAGNFTTLTTSSTVTHNGGTANGVAYLDGSKVLTTGTAFTFDGANVLTLFRTTPTEANEPTIKFSNLTFAGQNPGVVKSSNGGLALDIQSPSASAFQQRSRIYMNGGSNDSILFQTSSNNGSTYGDRMVLTSTGLGIGTSSPAQILSLSSADTTGTAINIINTGTGGYNWNLFSVGSSSVVGNVGSFAIRDSTNAVTRLTIDTTGNLGIGTSSPSTKLDVGATSDVGISMTNSTSVTSGNRGTLYMSNSSNSTVGFIRFGAVTDNSGTDIQFAVRPAGGSLNSTAMKLDSSGKLFLGTTTTPTGTGSGIFNVEPGNQNGIAIGVVTTGNTGLDINVNNTGSYFAYFRYNAANVGSITTNGTITVYNTTSDYRLKTVVGAVSDSGSRIDALQPVEYTWNSNGERTRGFLAHQFQEVYANSVTGTKDAVDADGKPVYQAMQASTSEVIADLVAELQSLRARVAQLESKP